MFIHVYRHETACILEPEASAGAVCLMCVKLIELSVIWIQRL